MDLNINKKGSGEQAENGHNDKRHTPIKMKWQLAANKVNIYRAFERPVSNLKE